MAGRTYQVLYQSGTADKGHLLATLQDATGVQGTALFIIRTNSTAATLYLNSGDKYLWSATATATNITKLVEPPKGATSDQLTPPVQARKASLLAAADTPVATADAPVSIDVLILYTSAAAAAVGGTSNILDKARLAVAEANQCYLDSKVFITLNLVGVEPVSYTESPSMATDLQRLSSAGDGYLEEVQTLRDSYKADLVCLFNSSSDGYSGMAWVGYVGITKEWGYSVVQAVYSVGYFTFPHEIGHNLGCAHDRDHTSYDGAYPYSFGYRFNAVNLQFRTIMAYPPGIQIGLFSSPNSTFLGVAAGTANEDNVSTHNQLAAAIADNYPSPKFTLTITKNGTGAILCNGTNAPASIVMARGQVLKLTAQGNLLCWSGTQFSQSTNVQVSLTANGFMTANFADGTSPLAPVVTLNPLSQSLTAGATLGLTAGGFGIPAPLFRWFKDGVDQGVTGTILTLPNVTITNQGTYVCILSNSAGSASSGQALVVVGAAPQFVQQPVSQLAQLGGSAAFSVIMDSDNLAYQWFFNGSPVPSATQRIYTLANIQPSDMGNYYVEATRGGTTVRSTEAQLLLASPPAITQQPQRVEITRGQSATFSTSAVGIQPIAYQWQFNAANIINQPNATLSLNNVQPGSAGSYRVQVSNPNGITTSTNVTLVVYDPLVIGQQPFDITAVKGNTPIFSVTASGSAPITYQWYCNGAPLTNQVYSTCRLKVVQPTNAGTYYVIVQNPSGQVQSGDAKLIVLDPPVISAQPQQAAADEGGAATFTVQTTGRTPMAFQWSHNSTAIPGGTGANLLLSGVSPSDAGNYSVTITNADGGIVSSSATLTVNVPPLDYAPAAGHVHLGGIRGVILHHGVGGSPTVVHLVLQGPTGRRQLRHAQSPQRPDQPGGGLLRRRQQSAGKLHERQCKSHRL